MGIRIAICVDERGGLYFNNRRQSRDRFLINDLMSHVKADEKIYVSEYSLPLFKDYSNVCVCSSLTECPDGCICFVELFNPNNCPVRIEELIIYNWGEAYPYDERLDVDFIRRNMTLVFEKEFVGSSHDKIIKEVYR